MIMTKTEYKVGETFQFGLKTLKCVDNGEEEGCDNCIFHDMKCVDLDEFTGPCAKGLREDGKRVAFIEVEETDKQE